MDEGATHQGRESWRSRLDGRDEDFSLNTLNVRCFWDSQGEALRKVSDIEFQVLKERSELEV